MVFLTLIKFTKRVPLIKFRKGGLLSAAASAAPAAAATVAKVASSVKSSSPPPAKPSLQQSSQAIEDSELHPRYWRKAIDTPEMDYINNGGPN